MATTSNFGWPTPDDTDLVKDGASAIRSLGSAIDTTVAAGYRYAGTRYYTSSGTFAKADPLGTGDIGLRAVRVRLVGGGGGSGGCGNPAAGQASVGAGGGGAGYAESFIEASTLASSETVTRGAAGAAGTQTVAGGAGGTSSFGSHVSATGGGGGGIVAPAASGIVAGGTSGTGTGTFAISGAPGGIATIVSATVWHRGPGGGSAFAPQGRPTYLDATGGPGEAGLGPGGGATGAGRSAGLTGFVGAAGGAGIVIIDCFV